jgi:hypothetical protein
MYGDLGRAGRAGAWVTVALIALSGCNAAPGGDAAAPGSGAAPAKVLEDVRVATDRSALKQEVVTLPNGQRMQRMSGSSGFTHVLVAKPGPDGKPSVSCVDSPGEAEAFFTSSHQGAGQ